MAQADLSPLGALARAGDPDRFLCALFAPAAKREALFTLIAFNHEIARAREAASNPMAALIRLQWWRDAIEAARAGRPPLRHEVAGPLATAIADGALDADDLLAMVNAREAETEDAIPARGAFDAYLRGSAGGFAVAAGRLLAGPGPHLAALQALGAVYGLAGVLRSVSARAEMGQCLLPADLLAAQGLTPADVLRAPGAEAVQAVIGQLAREGAVGCESARRVAALPRAAIAAALPVVLARRDLARLARGRDGGGARGIGDRLAVLRAGLMGRI